MRRGGALALGLLLLGVLQPIHAHPGPLLLYVRVEGQEDNLFHGWIEVPESLALTAANSGRSYAIHGHSPLGALLAAGRAGGLAIDLSDEFLGMDFSVEEIEGEATQGIHWWDYRVNSIATYYGSHFQWLAFGPGLQAGDEVVWYLEAVGVSPLRVSATTIAEAPDDRCLHALRVDVRLPDIQHQAGRPWPPASWTPAPIAELRGAWEAPVVGGFSLASAARGSEVWADRERFVAGVDWEVVRSDVLRLEC